ncbi:related to TOK1 - Voltage-gated, outward-rectifying K+ channel protein of the plasma membrane [Ustilago sp. UG-2017b]|nr:related to TOK1 - Voltage-gated, outward-rectifying K+ channel protein of the plasma membrane [Ustilago sp. UG-2017b]
MDGEKAAAEQLPPSATSTASSSSHQPASHSARSCKASQGGGLEKSTTIQTFLTVTDNDVHHPAHHSLSVAHPSSSHAFRVRKTPIFSGLLAPFSIVLEVPGLTSKWYADINPEGQVIRFIPNPTILTVGLSISLTSAVIANFAIILRFLEILRPRQSIALAIASLALHDIINVVALAVFGGIYGPKNDGLSLSASYWMVCAGTITSTLVTASLVIDYVRTKDFKHAGSGLTQLQKGLVLAGMGLLLYLSLGSLIFVFVIGVDFITALYFSTATVLTVGFGDVVPGSAGGKVLVVLYAPTGIVLVALVVSAARSAMLETFQATLLERTKERRRRIRERKERLKEEKREERALKKALPRTFTLSASEGNDFAEALARMEQDASSHPLSSLSTTANTITTPPPATAGDPILQSEIASLSHQLLLAKARTESDFRTYESHTRREAITAARIKLLLASSVTLAFWLLGAVAFTYAERWSYGGAMWFCFIAMITIGYGDYHPSTQLGMAIFVIWGLMGVAVLTILLAVVQDAFGSIFARVLTNSAQRLFSRGEKRMRRRRSRERMEGGGDFEAQTQARSRNRRGGRKSEGDLPQAKLSARTGEGRKSADGCIEKSTAAVRTSTPEPIESKEGSGIKFTIPSAPLTSDEIAGVRLPATTEARMEETLVSTPQKLAFAALQTFQHSVRLLQLHDHTISQAMCEIPALRHYYNSRQNPGANASLEQDQQDREALRKLEEAIKQNAKPEYEKVCKLVVANLEFQHHLRILLGGFQDLKDRVEGFKHQLHRPSSQTSELEGKEG